MKNMLILSRRKKILAIAAAVLILLGVLLWVLRISNIIKTPTSNTNEPPKFQAPSVNVSFDANLKPSVSSDELSAINLAKNYAERFGSYSTDQPGANLVELESLSTKKMNKYLDSITIDYQAKMFSGISTKSVSTKIDSFGADQASITVQTQRTETKADLTLDIYYQDIKIDLVKSKDAWLVDGAFWQDKK